MNMTRLRLRNLKFVRAKMGRSASREPVNAEGRGKHSDPCKMEIDPMYRIYIRIDGEGFNPDRFQDEHGKELGGSVGVTKRVRGDGTQELARTNWKSEIVQSRSGDPEDALLKLLLKLRPTLVDMRDDKNMRVIAQVVQDVSRRDEASGLFLPREAIQLLADVGASFDFDISHRQK
jgi:hypothetical protein